MGGEIITTNCDILQAAKHIAEGGVIAETRQRASGRGRPKTVYLAGEIVLSAEDLDTAKMIAAQRSTGRQPGPMTPEEFETMSRQALPQLLHRAITLAMVSEKLSDVLAVAKEIADRGYGKSVQQATITHKNGDVRKAWAEFDSYTGPPIDAETVQ